jgi:hypothetical protein
MKSLSQKSVRERVAELLIHAVQTSGPGNGFAASGRKTAEAFSYEMFRRRWIEEFASALQSRS